jgi:hypothetical protein
VTACRPARPGAKYGKTTLTKIDFISLSMALVLGTAGLPHVLMRFYTVPTSKEARKSVVWAIWLIGLFYLFTLVLGFGAAALVGPTSSRPPPAARTPRPRCWPTNSAAPAAGLHLRGRVRDDPRGGRRPDDHGERVVRPRHLQQVIKRGQVSADDTRSRWPASRRS